ncbi:MAG TPA: hypothetical protein VEG26_07810 [Steroidobacteraceae bacterium]|nr:hypothetical protein [Steroidobacteraceae bacterium]
MAIRKSIARTIPVMLALILVLPGCVVEPREGYYDQDHHRWWHEHHWHDCAEREEHCRE